MYAYIEGIVAEKGHNEIVLDAGGIGYQLMCSANTLSLAPQAGESMRAYTFLNVREDALELFGFATREEKGMFLKLTGVSGIGPRTALAILGSMPLRDLSLAIVTGDIAMLSRAPGVGKKTAQRLALELKELVSQDELSCLPDFTGVVPARPDTPEAEACQALQALGYTQAEAAGAVSRVRGGTDKADEIIRLALRSMMKG
jgi:holliday junction DNA helicase RuvA